MPPQDMDAFIEAVAHPTRRLALKMAAEGPISGSGLAREVGSAQPTAWKHLSRLVDLGLLRRTPEEIEASPDETGLVTNVQELERLLRDMLVAVHPRGLEEVVFIGENPEEVVAWPGTDVKGKGSGNGSASSSKGGPRC